MISFLKRRLFFKFQKIKTSGIDIREVTSKYSFLRDIKSIFFYEIFTSMLIIPKSKYYNTTL